VKKPTSSVRVKAVLAIEKVLSAELDAYSNRILLCPTHHELVDKDTNSYSEERLRQIKVKHESAVQVPTTVPKVPLVAWKGVQALSLSRMESGSLLNVFAGRQSSATQTPSLLSREEADVGELLDVLQDTCDIWDDLSWTQRLSSEVDLTQQIETLLHAGFVVYAGVRSLTLVGGLADPAPWHEANIAVFRSDDPAVRVEV